MNLFWRLAALVSALFLLTACELAPISERKPFEAGGGEAVILVGLISSEKAMRFNEENLKAGSYWLRDFRKPEVPFRDANVYAYFHPVGKNFKIVRIVIPGGYTFQEANLSSAPSLTPQKVGIYYYGTIDHSIGMVGVNDREKVQLLRLAREKYKNIFERLAPVNFK